MARGSKLPPDPDPVTTPTPRMTISSSMVLQLLVPRFRAALFSGEPLHCSDCTKSQSRIINKVGNKLQSPCWEDPSSSLDPGPSSRVGSLIRTIDLRRYDRELDISLASEHPARSKKIYRDNVTAQESAAHHHRILCPQPLDSDSVSPPAA
jgi:hypothetical protein